MLNLQQLSNRIDDLSAHRLSIDDFEDWFREESYNAHIWGTGRLMDAVFAIEAVFSEYYYANLGNDGLRREMAKAIRPFEEKLRSPLVVRVSTSAKSENKEFRLGDAQLGDAQNPRMRKVRASIVQDLEWSLVG